MRRSGVIFAVGIVLGSAWGSPSGATEILYVQDFEDPNGFVNDGGDVNIYRTVNQLYGDQPPGFRFAQANTVETLLVTGTRAFGTGYSDPSGIGGNYALGMLSDFQNDLLGLSFDVGSRRYLNFRLTISSIDLSVFSGPFVPVGGLAPVFELSLYDNPSGVVGLGSGTPLDRVRISGTASPRTVFDWTEHTVPLDASGATNGNVTLRIDLITGGYAAMDNFRIAASDVPGDVGVVVPEPGGATALGIGLASAWAGLRVGRRRRVSAEAG